MDIVGLISSVSKIAIGAFVVTLVIVVYETSVLIKKRNAEKKAKEKDVKLPEFKGKTQKTEGFSPVAVGQAATQPAQLGTRKLSKPFIPILLGLGVLIVILGGFLIYRRNQVSPVEVETNEVSPVSKDAQEQTERESIPLEEPDKSVGESQIGAGEATQTPVSPTETIIQPTQYVEEDTDDDTSEKGESPSEITPTVTPTSPSVVTSTPTPTILVITPTVQPTTSIISTATPVPSTLPESGTYQTSLLFSIAALAVIYLALIL